MATSGMIGRGYPPAHRFSAELYRSRRFTAKFRLGRDLPNMAFIALMVERPATADFSRRSCKCHDVTLSA
jgi:hypothetical protein